VLSLQAAGLSGHRFLYQSLLLTAGCVWLVNSLHAWPDNGHVFQELMQSILPLTEINGVGGVMVESAAYSPNRRAEWMFLGDEAYVEARR